MCPFTSWIRPVNSIYHPSKGTSAFYHLTIAAGSGKIRLLVVISCRGRSYRRREWVIGLSGNTKSGAFGFPSVGLIGKLAVVQVIIEVALYPSYRQA
jgi:hypothetical protein